MWGHNAAWPELTAPIKEAPVVLLAQKAQYLGNHLVVLPSCDLKPDAPPDLTVEKMEEGGLAVMKLSPEKYAPLKEGFKEIDSGGSWVHCLETNRWGIMCCYFIFFRFYQCAYLLQFAVFSDPLPFPWGDSVSAQAAGLLMFCCFHECELPLFDNGFL